MKGDTVARSIFQILFAVSVAGLSGKSALAEPALSLVFDGTTHVFAPQMEGARTGFTRFLAVDAVSIEGKDGVATLVLELSLPPGARTGDAPHDARISFRPDGWQDYWVSPLDFPAGAIVIDHLDLSSQAPAISGQFAVPLCYTASPIHPPDPEHCLPATGRFTTALVRD